MKNYILFSVILASCILFSCSSKEEKKQAAEDEGNFITETKARFVKGIGEGLKGEGKEAAEALTEGAGEVYNGANSGFDKSLKKVDVKLDPALRDYITLGRSGKNTNDSTGRTDVSIYCIFKQDYKGKVLVRALDKENIELGRSTQKVDAKADDAQYVEFEFDKRTPINLVKYFTLEKR